MQVRYKKLRYKTLLLQVIIFSFNATSRNVFSWVCIAKVFKVLGYPQKDISV